MKRKNIPIIIMLLAGAFTSIIMYVMNYEIGTVLWVLLVVLLVFYIIGLVIKKVLDFFDQQNKIKEDIPDEGAVIEKEVNEEGSGNSPSGDSPTGDYPEEDN